MATSHGPVLPSFTEFRGKKNRFLPSCYRVFFFFVLKNTISKKRRERKNSVPSFTEFRGPSYRVSRGKKIDFYRVFTEFFFLEFFLSFRVWQGANKKKTARAGEVLKKKKLKFKKKIEKEKKRKKKGEQVTTGRWGALRRNYRVQKKKKRKKEKKRNPHPPPQKKNKK